MPIIKCKMCGGDLKLIEGSSVCECEYCGTKQTVPTADNDKKLTLFARANRLRAANEFDKAAGVYENLVADFPEEAEAYWGLVLCRYGIEYVDDPATGKKIPTCHRSSFDSILEDEDFEQACENADAIARRVYREEAKAIEDIRRGILEISGKEEPYDIFICYKETDDNGDRTIDSVLAQDVYDSLTEKGYRVFFSRISLEDKLGTEYEPYIFAALNSAKIMLVFGTDYEYFNAVWVKNEWSRFLALMARGEKKTLIPCYKEVDAYDMPKEFRRLQAQDMGKVGAVQDLLRGIEKLLGPKENQQAGVQPPAQTVIQAAGPNADSLLRRGEMALEDSNWTDAQNFFNRVLDMVPESAEAFLGLAMASANCRDRAAFQTAFTAADCPWRTGSNVKRARQFGDEDLLTWFDQLDREAAASDETARIAKAKAAEEARIAREKAEEEARIARKRAEEEARIRAEKEKVEQEQLYRKRAQSRMVSKMLAVRKSSVIALTAEGKVLTAGTTLSSSWNYVAAIYSYKSWLYGLRFDGTVVSAGGGPDLSHWRDIVDLAICNNHIAGLKADGTVELSIYRKSDIKDLGKEVSTWTDIIAVSVDNDAVRGIKKDRSTVAVGYPRVFDPTFTCSSFWGNDVAFMDADINSLVPRDGKDTVFEKGLYAIQKEGKLIPSNPKYPESIDGLVDNPSEWHDLVAMDDMFPCTVGVRSDGTLAVSGFRKSDGQGEMEKIGSTVRTWRLFDSLETLLEARSTGKERQRKDRLSALEAEKQKLQAELPERKGLFSGGRRKEIQSRLDEIDAELKSLSQQ